MKPIVNKTKNKIMVQKPKKLIDFNEITHGNRKLISKSKIKNKIATK